MLIAIIVGIVFGIMGVIIFISEYSEMKRCTCEAEAVVMAVKEEVQLHRSGRMHYQTYYYPIIEFTAQDRLIRAEPRLKAYTPDFYQPGKQLKILYNPKNPYDLMLEGKNSLQDGIGGMLIMFVLGAIFVYIGMRTK